MAPEAGSARSSGGGAAAPALPPPGDGAFCAFDDLHVRHSRCGGAVPHNTMQEVPLDTELFEGKLIVAFKVRGSKHGRPGSSGGEGGGSDEQQAAAAAADADGADAAAAAAAEGRARAAALFQGKQRLQWIVLQGRFKRPDVSLDTLKLGSVFSRALRLPGSVILAPALSWIASRMGGGISIRPSGRTPHILSPLCAAAQIMHVALPGQQPADLFGFTEDTRLLLGDSAPAASSKRRSLMASAAARAGRTYSTDHVYTFAIYDHAMNYAEFRLPFFGLDMVKILDGQALPFIIKDFATGDTMLDLQFWHRRLLLHPANAAAAAAAAVGAHAIEFDSSCDDTSEDGASDGSGAAHAGGSEGLEGFTAGPGAGGGGGCEGCSGGGEGGGGNGDGADLDVEVASGGSGACAKLAQLRLSESAPSSGAPSPVGVAAVAAPAAARG